MIVSMNCEKVMNKLGYVDFYKAPNNNPGHTLIMPLPDDPLFDKLMNNEEFAGKINDAFNDIIYNAMKEYYKENPSEYLSNMGIPVTILQDQLFKDLTQ